MKIMNVTNLFITEFLKSRAPFAINPSPSASLIPTSHAGVNLVSSRSTTTLAEVSSMG